MDPFFWFALAIACGALWRIGSWLGSGGRLPLRGRRGSGSGFTSAGLAAQTFYHPGARQVAEMQHRESERREDDDEGDPPHPGAE